MQIGPGTRLGSYEIIAPLGAGGMGEVYLAHDTRLERDVAIKILRADTAGDEQSRQRLIREARLASRLNHPSIVTIYDVGLDGNQCFIAMEYVRGRSLRDVLEHSCPPLAQALTWGMQICDALSKAHQSGII